MNTKIIESLNCPHLPSLALSILSKAQIRTWTGTQTRTYHPQSWSLSNPKKTSLHLSAPKPKPIIPISLTHDKPEQKIRFLKLNARQIFNFFLNLNQKKKLSILYAKSWIQNPNFEHRV